MPLIRLAVRGEIVDAGTHKKRQKQGARCMIQGICWCRTYFCHILWLKTGLAGNPKLAGEIL